MLNALSGMSASYILATPATSSDAGRKLEAATPYIHTPSPMIFSPEAGVGEPGLRQCQCMRLHVHVQCAPLRGRQLSTRARQRSVHHCACCAVMYERVVSIEQETAMLNKLSKPKVRLFGVGPRWLHTTAVLQPGRPGSWQHSADRRATGLYTCQGAHPPGRTSAPHLCKRHKLLAPTPTTHTPRIRVHNRPAPAEPPPAAASREAAPGPPVGRHPAVLQPRPHHLQPRPRTQPQ